jgi:hypothetical protein
MKKFCSVSLILAMIASLLPAGVFAQEPEADEVDDEQVAADAAAQPLSAWPVRFDDAGTDFVVYPPQFDTWKDGRLEGRAAVAVTREGAEAPDFGVVWLSARTEAGAAGDVTIRNLEVGKADFPTLSANSGDYVAALRRQLEPKTWQVAQERLQNDLAIDDATRRTAVQPVKNEVPKVVFSQQPAILVPVDGAPSMRDVPGTGLKRIVNTRALMLFDPAQARYYLYVSDRWMEAQKLEGPWSAAANAPSALDQAKELAVNENQVDLLAPDDEDGAVPKASVIYVSTTPTELLQTDGAPQYAPIENTRLLYVTNSPNRIFLDTATQVHYVLISGRWFHARNLGPDAWEYVSAASLPGDFARIPATHPTENVRAAVAGTPQAREAAIENTVPQVATVNRSSTALTVRYDGDPSFQPVEGTSLQRAVNAPIPVIRVTENSFYALDNGVWFVAGSPFGPWAVAGNVPAVVYSIPRNSPIHYVTYVRVYDATPDVVYVGYTPGYVGSYISSDNVVVYGSGWYHRPWIGTYWYSAPITWGFGFTFVHSWWRPWRPYYHHAHWAPPCYRPAWGPWHYRSARRANVTVINNVTVNRVNVRRSNVANIYNRWDRREVARNRSVEPPRRIAGAPDRGRGYITRPDGSRRYFGEGERGGGRDRNGSAQRRSDTNGPGMRGGERRADNGSAAPDRMRPNGDLPRIQGPTRRWDRDGERRADASARPDNPQRAQPNGAPPRIQGPDRRWNRNDDRRADASGRPGDAQRSQPNGELPRIQGPTRRWDRDDGVRRRPDGDGTGWRRGGADQPPRQPAQAQRPGAAQPDRREWSRQDRRDSGQLARPQRRDATPGERREFSRQERRDSSSRPQAQSQGPRFSAPSAQARPPSASMPQAQRSAPQRAERRSEGRPRAEGRSRGDGGGRNVGGGGFRPQAR